MSDGTHPTGDNQAPFDVRAFRKYLAAPSHKPTGLDSQNASTTRRLPELSNHTIANSEQSRHTNQDDVSLWTEAKGVVGFIIGVVGGIAIEAALLYVVSLGDPTTVRPIGLGWFWFPILSGSGTAAVFKMCNFGNVFDRISYGMNPRLPAAIFTSWLLVWNSYLWLAKSSFSDWYDENTAKYWMVTFVPPLVLTAIAAVFHWATHPERYRK
jgi:hypothetical protein